MALELSMLGLIVHDMSQSVAFYRRLGLSIAEGSEDKTHIEVKMEAGLTFFLDSQPTRWDPKFVMKGQPDHSGDSDRYDSLLEFNVLTQEAVEAKYTELTGYGYQSSRAPYATTFGMCFAMLQDPDGNTILLSGKLTTNAL